MFRDYYKSWDSVDFKKKKKNFFKHISTGNVTWTATIYWKVWDIKVLFCFVLFFPKQNVSYMILSGSFFYSQYQSYDTGHSIFSPADL